ncbi:unnamed protein product [Chondrus crispus]|uniref:Thymidylate kinase n=1 Tax=Chondrus crispus TaxID=2769 RepID=R7Q5I2_CHOCR|nr:unnamed protein product [Chondrus crispus]CDF33279.1 unnamed protein product [Chondrus crispus]|eukprot:XP_005713082.1 unnamed protein product [Chondrus crispus]
MPRGTLIVFEGLDRCGKTTQTRLCVEGLSRTGVKLAAGLPWRFPDRTTPIGEVLNTYLTSKTELGDEAAHLLFSANRWEKAATIREALGRGETVVYDRYAYSGVAYSVAKGLGMEWCLAADEGLPRPDVVVFLEVGVDEARGREGFGGERFEEAETQKRVGAVFDRLKGEGWSVVEGSGRMEEVAERVKAVVWPVVQAVTGRDDEVGELWGQGVRKRQG